MRPEAAETFVRTKNEHRAPCVEGKVTPYVWYGAELAASSFVFILSRPSSRSVQIASSSIRAPFASHAGGFAAVRQYHIASCLAVYATTSKDNAHRRTAGAEVLRASALA